MNRLAGQTFPWGALAVNLTGSVLIGVFVAMAGPEGWFADGAMARHFMIFGIFGGFTTFSAFGLQTLHLMQSGKLGRCRSQHRGVGGCLLGVWAGHELGLASAR